MLFMILIQAADHVGLHRQTFHSTENINLCTELVSFPDQMALSLWLHRYLLAYVVG